MILHRTRSAIAAALVAAVATLSLVAPTPGSARMVDAPVLAEVAAGARVIVSVAGNQVQAATRAAIEALGGTIVAELPVLGSFIADVPASQVDAVASVPGVVRVTSDEPVTLQAGVPDPTIAPDATGPKTLGADRVWAKGYDGSGIGIAVIDTGVTEIGDLAGRVIGGVDLTPEQTGLDSYGHGTPIAWLAAGNGAASGGRWTGVAPGAHIVPVKIAGADGSTEIARLLVALDWVARNASTYDIRVVNLSLGSTPAAVDLVNAAVQRLWDLGLVVVVAAGNNGPGTLGTPASNTHVITVGSSLGKGTASTSDDVAASWSGTGVDADGVLKPDVTAPGQSLVVGGAPLSWAYLAHPSSRLGGGYQRATGTSFTTGLISGAAALMLDAHPDWTPNEVLGQLLDRPKAISGTHAPTPWLPRSLKIEDPAQANTAASRANLLATPAPSAALLALGPLPPQLLAQSVGSPAAAIAYGTEWYSTGWYSTGWYSTGWYGTEWSSTGWYSTGWYSTGWYSTGWYSTGWYSTGWYSTGWYGSSWS